MFSAAGAASAGGGAAELQSSGGRRVESRESRQRSGEHPAGRGEVRLSSSCFY